MTARPLSAGLILPGLTAASVAYLAVRFVPAIVTDLVRLDAGAWMLATFCAALVLVAGAVIRGER